MAYIKAKTDESTHMWGRLTDNLAHANDSHTVYTVRALKELETTTSGGLQPWYNLIRKLPFIFPCQIATLQGISFFPELTFIQALHFDFLGHTHG